MHRWLPLIGLLLLAPVAATVSAASTTPTGDSKQGVRNGEWIAYSTAPHGATPSTIARRNWGGDVFLVRQGGQPALVAGRGAGRSWNGCPTFSPDGTKLAFGTKTPGVGKSVTVVRVTHAGASATQRVRMKVVRGDDRLAPCPLWSSDGSRLAYMSAGEVVVRGLDGSLPRARAGDPVKADFAARTRSWDEGHDVPIVSPTGDLVALLADSPCGVVVQRPDGSHRRNLDVGCTYPFYAVAAWSPDGRRLLVMRDVSGWHFTMFAVSVDPPFTHVPVVEHVRVPNSHTWPGRGDVSWRPRPSAGAAPPPKFWSASRCEQALLGNYGLGGLRVPNGTGHLFGIAQAICVGRGAPVACRWTAGHGSRLYSQFRVFTRSSINRSVVRSWTLATRAGHGLAPFAYRRGGPTAFYMSRAKLLATDVTAARFRSIVAPIAARLNKQENATGCTGG